MARSEHEAAVISTCAEFKDTLQPFQYEALPENHIRLVHVHRKKTNRLLTFSMIVVSIDEHTPYDALSYTWGDPRPNVHPQPGRRPKSSMSVLMNGARMDIGGNLFLALRQLNPSNTFVQDEELIPFFNNVATSKVERQRYLWVDALSINQGDASEKASQVEKMDQIYTNATSVIAWLGAEDEHTVMAMRVMKGLAQVPLEKHTDHKWYSPLQIGLDEDHPAWVSLVAFFSRAWFRRVWVVQEVALSKRLYVIVGKIAISADLLSRVTWYMLRTDLWPKIEKARKALVHPDSNKMDNLPLGTVPGALTGTFSLLPDPLIAISLGRGSEATDPRDYIYGMYGVVKEICRKHSRSLNLPKVGYEASMRPNELFIDLARLMMNEGKVKFLLGMVEDKGWREIKTLPSWVPDQSVSMVPTSLMKQDPGWKPTGSWDLGKIRYVEDSRRLRTMALQFDFVVAAGPPLSSIRTENIGRAVTEFIKPLLGETNPYAVLLDAVGRTLIAESQPYSQNHPGVGNMFVDWAVTRALLEYSRDDDSHVLPTYEPFLACDPNREVVPEPKPLRDYLSSDPERASRRLQFLWRSNMVMTYRRLFLTSRNYLGITAESATVGDEVWILPETAAPYVLRPTTDGSFELMGEAYVHGIMNGEAANWTGNDALECREIEIS